MMKDDEWRRGGCGYDSTEADTYITNTRNEQGRAHAVLHRAPVASAGCSGPGGARCACATAHSFTAGRPNQLGGGYTEVRTVEATIRKLR